MKITLDYLSGSDIITSVFMRWRKEGQSHRCCDSGSGDKSYEIKICIETNENENTTTQNLWDMVNQSKGESS